MTPDSAFVVVVAYAAGAVLLAWLYFSRFRVTRPPIGVFNLRDVGLLIGAIVLVPYLYLVVPLWLVATLLGLGMLTILQITFEHVLPGRWTAWVVALVLIGTDVGAALAFGAPSTPFLVANNTVLAIGVTGAANLWVQSGMKARDVAVLGAALVVYDFVATSLLPLMNDLIDRLANLPFAPQITWTSSDNQWLGVGLGDLLLAAVFPLAMRKAYGRTAGLLALALGLVALAAMLALLDVRLVHVTLPAMVVLGPLMVAQYLFWARRLGTERTTWQYLQAEPRDGATRKRAPETETSNSLEVAGNAVEPGAFRRG